MDQFGTGSFVLSFTMRKVAGEPARGEQSGQHTDPLDVQFPRARIVHLLFSGKNLRAIGAFNAKVYP